jgi:hypothetical protein
MADDPNLGDLWVQGRGDGLDPPKTNRPQPRQPHIGCPWAFLADVCRRTEGRTALVVAICIYRRTKVCRSPTVTLPAAELAELGIDRRRKQEALAMLQAAGLVNAERIAGHTTKVTLTWQPE